MNPQTSLAIPLQIGRLSGTIHPGRLDTMAMDIDMDVAAPGFEPRPKFVFFLVTFWLGAGGQPPRPIGLHSHN